MKAKSVREGQDGNKGIDDESEKAKSRLIREARHQL